MKKQTITIKIKINNNISNNSKSKINRREKMKKIFKMNIKMILMMNDFIFIILIKNLDWKLKNWPVTANTGDESKFKFRKSKLCIF